MKTMTYLPEQRLGLIYVVLNAHGLTYFMIAIVCRVDRKQKTKELYFIRTFHIR